MKRILGIFIFLAFGSLGQNSTVFQVWNEAGIGLKIDKKQSLGLDLTTRFDAAGLCTVFPQVSYKYKINKYLRPSIDYRIIADRSKSGSFVTKHRLNFNLQISHKIERVQLGLRLRYQYSSNRLASNFETEFGQALRIKPSVSYNLKNSALEPNFSAEFFTGPMDGQLGYHLNRIRWNIGLSYSFDGPHSIELAYLYDQRIHSPESLNRAIMNFSYNYQIPKNKTASKHRNAKTL